jgi:hypothetical protein
MDHETFQVPFLFKMSAKPKRARNLRDIYCLDVHTVTVASISGDDAPVAAAWTASTVGQEKTYTTDGPVVELRRDGKNLLAMTIDPYAKTALIPSILRDFSSTLETGVRPRIAYIDDLLVNGAESVRDAMIQPFEPDRMLSRFERYDAANFSEIASSERDAKIAAIEALYGNMRIVDGVFWKRVPEPRYRLSYGHADRRYGHPAYVYVSIEETNETANNIFNLNDWDALAKYSLAAHGLEVDPAQSAEIFIQAAFGFDKQDIQFRRDIRNAAFRDADALKTFDVETLVAWAGLRDAQAAFGKNDSEPLDSRVTADLIDAAEAYARAPSTPAGSRDDILRILDGYDSRPIAREIGHVVKPA